MAILAVGVVARYNIRKLKIKVVSLSNGHEDVATRIIAARTIFTYALFALDKLGFASTATAPQLDRGRSVCLRTSRIYSSMPSAFVSVRGGILESLYVADDARTVVVIVKKVLEKEEEEELSYLKVTFRRVK